MNFPDLSDPKSSARVFSWARLHRSWKFLDLLLNRPFLTTAAPESVNNPAERQNSEPRLLTVTTHIQSNSHSLKSEAL